MPMSSALATFRVFSHHCLLHSATT
jgi:hypothetical protein